jgi:hypothetical protein
VILIRDAARRERRLFLFTSATSDPRLSELPPVPPAGMLDARFVPSNSTGVVLSLGATDPELSLQVSSGGGSLMVSWDINDPDLAVVLEDFGGPAAGDVILRGVGCRDYVLPAGRVIGRITGERMRVAGAQGPRDFVLEQNHPNPFNPSTTIGYYLPSASNVRLTIYDLLGRVVGEPENGYREAGSHSISWDARGLSSGVYYYTLEASGDGSGPERRILTKMMFLLR